MDNKNTFPKQLFYLSSIFMMVASLALSIYEIVMSSASYIPNGASDPAVWSLLTAVLSLGLFVFGIICCVWEKGRFGKEFISALYLSVSCMTIGVVHLSPRYAANLNGIYSVANIGFYFQILVLGILVLAFRPRWPKAANIMLASGAGSVMLAESVSFFKAISAGNPYLSIIYACVALSMAFFFVIFLLLATKKSDAAQQAALLEEKAPMSEEDRETLKKLDSLLASGIITQEEYDKFIEKSIKQRK